MSRCLQKISKEKTLQLLSAPCASALSLAFIDPAKTVKEIYVFFMQLMEPQIKHCYNMLISILFSRLLGSIGLSHLLTRYHPKGCSCSFLLKFQKLCTSVQQEVEKLQIHPQWGAFFALDIDICSIKRSQILYRRAHSLLTKSPTTARAEKLLQHIHSDMFTGPTLRCPSAQMLMLSCVGTVSRTALVFPNRRAG